MQPVGQSALKFAQTVPVAKPCKVQAANFARMKEEWQIQVAADRALPGTSLRIALAWQRWLGRDTLLAWPAQSKLAELLHTSPRQIQTAMRALEESGHLRCESKFRGGRKSNCYRIILHGALVMDESGTNVPVTPEPGFRAEGNAASPVPGARVPGRGESDHRGTPERTPERTIEADRRTETGVPVTAHRAKGIMAEVFGAGRVKDGGYVQMAEK